MLRISLYWPSYYRLAFVSLHALAISALWISSLTVSVVILLLILCGVSLLLGLKEMSDLGKIHQLVFSRECKEECSIIWTDQRSSRMLINSIRSNSLFVKLGLSSTAECFAINPRHFQLWILPGMLTNAEQRHLRMFLRGAMNY